MPYHGCAVCPYVENGKRLGEYYCGIANERFGFIVTCHPSQWFDKNKIFIRECPIEKYDWI